MLESPQQEKKPFFFLGAAAAAGLVWAGFSAVAGVAVVAVGVVSAAEVGPAADVVSAAGAGSTGAVLSATGAEVAGSAVFSVAFATPVVARAGAASSATAVSSPTA